MDKSLRLVLWPPYRSMSGCHCLTTCGWLLSSVCQCRKGRKGRRSIYPHRKRSTVQSVITSRPRHCAACHTWLLNKYLCIFAHQTVRQFEVAEAAKMWNTWSSSDRQTSFRGSKNTNSKLLLLLDTALFISGMFHSSIPRWIHLSCSQSPIRSTPDFVQNSLV